MAVPSKKDRDSRLATLSSAVTAWSTKQKKRIEDQVAFSKRLLRGRNAANGLNNTTVSKASELLVDELDQFLTGE